MNCLLNGKYIAVEGLDNAMKMAKVLIEQEYQVFIQYEDGNIYIVAYANNDTDFGGDRFALISEDEVEMVFQNREDKKIKDAVETVKSNLKYGNLSIQDLGSEYYEAQKEKCSKVDTKR